MQMSSGVQMFWGDVRAELVRPGIAQADSKEHFFPLPGLRGLDGSELPHTLINIAEAFMMQTRNHYDRIRTRNGFFHCFCSRLTLYVVWVIVIDLIWLMVPGLTRIFLGYPFLGVYQDYEHYPIFLAWNIVYWVYILVFMSLATILIHSWFINIPVALMRFSSIANLSNRLSSAQSGLSFYIEPNSPEALQAWIELRFIIYQMTNAILEREFKMTMFVAPLLVFTYALAVALIIITIKRPPAYLVNFYLGVGALCQLGTWLILVIFFIATVNQVLNQQFAKHLESVNFKVSVDLWNSAGTNGKKRDTSGIDETRTDDMKVWVGKETKDLASKVKVDGEFYRGESDGISSDVKELVSLNLNFLLQVRVFVSDYKL